MLTILFYIYIDRHYYSISHGNYHSLALNHSENVLCSVVYEGHSELTIIKHADVLLLVGQLVIQIRAPTPSSFRPVHPPTVFYTLHVYIES